MGRGGHCCLIALVGVFSVFLGSFLQFVLVPVLLREPLHSTCWGKIFPFGPSALLTVEQWIQISRRAQQDAARPSKRVMHTGDRIPPKGKEYVGDGGRNARRWPLPTSPIIRFNISSKKKQNVILPVLQVVLDIGCGCMELERFLLQEENRRDIQYIPSDLIARDARTIICDLNKVRASTLFLSVSHAISF